MKDKKKIDSDFLHSVIKLRHDIPTLGKYTISSDFASIMIETVLNTESQTIIEAGSGISTVFLSYCIEKIGKGKILSFDHLENYAIETRKMIEQHKLMNVDVEVFHTPIRPYHLKGEIYNWYDISKAIIPNNIDMLIVDGPTRQTGRLARYPILPLLYDKLSDDAIILLDDANRADEKEIATRWINEFKDIKAEKFQTEKGAVRFSRMKSLS